MTATSEVDLVSFKKLHIRAKGFFRSRNYTSTWMTVGPSKNKHLLDCDDVSVNLESLNNI